MQEMKYFNEGNDCDICKNKLMTGRDGTVEDCRRRQNGFGWLSPTGVFTESPFGTHEESAEQICEEKGFTEEYWNWVKENRGNEINHLMRDFLSEVKGYCLIHNPSGYTGYIVTNMKNLTKQQKEFLYGYFMDMGDRFKAEQFVDFD